MTGFLTRLDPGMAPSLLLAAFGVALGAGMIKGLVGFAMPMVMISGLSLFLPPDIALGALILPTFVSNLMQMLRGGVAGLGALMARFRLYLLCLVVVLLGATQIVTMLSERVFFVCLGVPVMAFSLLQLAGWRVPFSAGNRWAEAAFGTISGFVGGLSGVWGPPTVAYLTALNLAKAEHVRVQGLIYFVGSVMLLLGHLRSGIVNERTLPLSAALLLPAIAGVFIGRTLQDRIAQDTFRRATLIVLLLAGANLLRRALF